MPFHAGELGLAAASDEQLLARAHSDGCIVVTLDADFHALLALAGTRDPSVVRLRPKGQPAGVVRVISKAATFSQAQS